MIVGYLENWARSLCVGCGGAASKRLRVWGTFWVCPGTVPQHAGTQFLQRCRSQQELPNTVAHSRSLRAAQRAV